MLVWQTQGSLAPRTFSRSARNYSAQWALEPRSHLDALYRRLGRDAMALGLWITRITGSVFTSRPVWHTLSVSDKAFDRTWVICGGWVVGLPPPVVVPAPTGAGGEQKRANQDSEMKGSCLPQVAHCPTDCGHLHDCLTDLVKPHKSLRASHRVTVTALGSATCQDCRVRR